MAVSLPTDADSLTRSATYLNRASDWTRFLWARAPSTTPSGGSYLTYFNDGDTSFTDPYIFLGSQPDTNNCLIDLFDGGSDIFSAIFTPTPGAWFWAAQVYDSIAHTLAYYVNGTLIDTLSIDLSAIAFAVKDQAIQGGTTAAAVGGSYVREWQATKTLVELIAESVSTTPVSSTSILTNTPLTSPSDLVDTVAGRDWTASGTPTFIAGPFPPSNLTPGTATAITTLPATIVLDTNDAPAGTGYAPSCGGEEHAVWFKRVALAGEVAWSVFGLTSGASNYEPCVSIWTGTPPGVTEDTTNDLCAVQRALQVPVTPGTTYYIQVSCGEPGLLDTDLTLSVQNAPDDEFATGSLLIPNDIVGNPGVILSATDGSILSLVNFPSGEEGDALPGGSICVEEQDASLTQVAVCVFDSDLSSVARITTWSGEEVFIRGDGASLFYVAHRAGAVAATLETITSAGVVGGSPWTLPSDSDSLRLQAPSPDSSILYYGPSASTGSATQAIHRYDLLGSAPLSDLVAAVGTEKLFGQMIVLPDGTILCGYVTAGFTVYTIRHYATDGSLLHSYVATGTRTLDRMAVVTGSSDSFWVRWFATSASLASIVERIRVSDGVAVLSFPMRNFVNGRGPFDPDGTLERFGPAPTCPLIVLTQGSAPPVPPVAPTFDTIPIRRMRRTPHLNQLHRRITYSSLELLAQVGEGLLSGQGSDPQMCLRWSDDGGRTWSREHWTTLGKIGEYRTRVLWRRLGQARDRVFEISVSDPVDVALITAYLDANVGTS